MDTYTLIIVIFTLLALIFTMLLFIKTPKKQRTLEYSIKKRTEYLKKRVGSYPKEYEATIIIGNKKEAFLSWLPHIVYFLPLIGLTLYTTKILEYPFCTTIFGINAALILIRIGFIGIPIGLFILSLSGIKMGIEAFNTGYYPPLNSIQFNDTIAIKRTFSKIRGALIVLLPIIILLSYLYLYMSFESNFIEVYKDKIKEECFSRSSACIDKRHPRSHVVRGNAHQSSNKN